jgi:hypothetical protein
VSQLLKSFFDIPSGKACLSMPEHIEVIFGNDMHSTPEGLESLVVLLHEKCADGIVDQKY